jgi:hypothetical protein
VGISIRTCTFFKSHKLELEPPPDKPAPTMSHSMPAEIQAYLFSHLLLVPATVGDDASGLFIVDSGANRSTVSSDLATRVALAQMRQQSNSLMIVKDL